MDSKEYYQKNKERILVYQNAYSKIPKNKQRAKEYRKLYYQNPKNKQRAKEYRELYCTMPGFKEKQKEYYKEYFQRPEVKQRQKEYNQQPKVKQRKKEYMAKYIVEYFQRSEVKQRVGIYENSKERKDWKKKYRKLYMPKYMRERCKQDSLFKLSSSLRGLVNNSLKRFGTNKGGRSWESLLGYSVGELKVHLESQFTPEMNWGNHGSYWHIDHCVPVSWFESEKALLERGWALSNLQPLERSVNLRKSNRYASSGQQTLLVDRKDFEGVI